MDKIIIHGGNRLEGEIEISGAKNAALPIMTATLLTDQEVNLSNIPDLVDVKTLKSLLQTLGSSIEKKDDIYILQSNNISSFTAPYEIVSKMRASIWVLAPLLARFGIARVSLPGGCAIGTRLVDLHISVLESMGASISIENGYIIASKDGRLSATNFTFNKISVGATITAILAAVLSEGTSYFYNCAYEPEITDLCMFLISMGAEIEGIGTRNIKIVGKKFLNGTSYKIIPDRIEAGTYLVAGAITKGRITVKGINYEMIKNICDKLEESGSLITYENDKVTIETNEIKPLNIDTEPFPGFPTDMQAQFIALMTLANGQSKITEHIFENRFMHVPELNRMGADINIDHNSAIIKGVQKLKGAQVMATDLRASVSLIIAGLVAEGVTTVSRVYHLDRGYYHLEEKLRKCGAVIERLKKENIDA